MTWEYRQLTGTDLEGELNALGSAGWEVIMAQCVDYTPGVQEGNGLLVVPPAYHMVVLLKRPLEKPVVPGLAAFTVHAAPTSVTAFVGRAPAGPLQEPQAIGSFAEFERDFGGLSLECPLAYAVRHYFLNGGEQALIVRVPGSGPGGEVTDADLAGPERAAAREGLWALEKVGGFNLLCIPPLTRTRDVGASTWAAALSYCRARGAMLLCDPPASWGSPADVTSAVERLFPAGEDLAHGALYYPRLRAPDPLQENSPESFAPCGAVAGLIARTDRTGGVWTAPAGRAAELCEVSAPERALTSGETAALAALGVNAIRSFNGPPVVWGARTLAGRDSSLSEWRYLPVRRLALHVERSVREALAGAGAQPGGEPLWTAVRAGVEDFLQAIFQQGAFPAPTPRESFFVRCGPETMTQSDLDAGRLVVEIGIAPVRPAEFVLLRIGQWTQADPP